MDLSGEDALRLNVLLANSPQAIRINESTMTVHALSEKGEAKVPLTPNCRDDKYLVKVRQMLSGHVLGSPGGYPVFLKRWTRMGQTRDDNLEQLLLLGEPEAVMAVVNSPGLTDELARRAWWIEPTSEMARQMLRWEAIRKAPMGKVLAEHLVEHLAFEDEPAMMIESVRLALSEPDLIDTAAKASIWKRGQRKNAFLLGFLISSPDDFPELKRARSDAEAVAGRLGAMAESGNPFARALLRTISPAGQTYLDTARSILSKPFNQDVVNLLLDTLATYFSHLLPDCENDCIIDELLADAEALCKGQDVVRLKCPSGLKALLETVPELESDVRALLILARLGYPVVRPIFSKSTAIGSLMRKKLTPVSAPIFAQIDTLTKASL
ncbi:MAG: sulfur reduction protein DsrS [Chromatiales bacterium]|nr:sulfur reduction protein DsrS [Chromatiales bacterium]